MTNLEIDTPEFSSWDMLPGWVEQVIQYYESESSRPKTDIDSEGGISFSIPTESDLSIRAYSIATVAESSANTVEMVTDSSEDNRNRSKMGVRGNIYGLASDIREDLPGNPPAIGDVLATGRYEIPNPLGLSNTPDSIRENDLVEWFADCFDCPGRILGTLNTDITLPEILTELANFLGEIETVLDKTIESFDTAQAVRRLCGLIPLGKWCIPDLTAFLAMMRSLLTQYWLVDPTLKFSWFGLIAALLYPIIQGAYSLLGMSLNLINTPGRCITTMMRQMRSLFTGVQNLDSAFGLSLGHLTATMQTTGSNDPAYSREVVALLQGKTDWFSGDTLVDYAEVLNLLNPLEVGLLAQKDFQFRLENLAEWFKSRLNALRSQSRESIFASLKFTNILLTLGRLTSFINAMIQLISEGKDVCSEQIDDSGNSIFVPSAPLDQLFLATGAIPPWVVFEYDPETNLADPRSDRQRQPDGGERVAGPTRPDGPSIIDVSLGIRYTDIGCLGKVSSQDEEKVRRWIEELDSLSLD